MENIIKIIKKNQLFSGVSANPDAARISANKAMNQKRRTAKAAAEPKKK